MPKIISYTPTWLSRPSPGFDLFSSGPSASTPLLTKGKSVHELNGKDVEKPYVGPRRTIARRGTEVFVAVGNQLRWSDLSMLKDDWEEDEKQIQRKGKDHRAEAKDEEGEGATERSYRELKLPIVEPIRQLIISPRGESLAILTAHTVHISLLPDSSHLGQPDTGPIRLKTERLGQIAHDPSQAPIVSALWHPLGVSGSCLVTVTADAVVRVWELKRENLWSFESPTLAIDLIKLTDGVSANDDFDPRKPSMGKGFSPDSIEMEVAAACFGGSGLNEEHGWASMTLWVAMKEGGIYALCPLLPTKWQPPPTLVPSLSTSVVSKSASLQDDVSVSPDNRRNCEQQYQWFSEIDNQVPIITTGDSESMPPVEIYNRPSHPGPIPKLQGPFEIQPDEIGDDLELTDIHVVAAKTDTEELLLDEDEETEWEELDQGGLSVTTVCLLTKGGRVHICLDLEGVEGKWLPNKKDKNSKSQDDAPIQSLVVLESLDTMQPAGESDTTWPMFSADVYSRYAFFVTHRQGVSYLSLSPWIQRLENELKGSDSTGAAFRIEIFTEGFRTLREQIVYQSNGTGNEDLPFEMFAGCVVLQDFDLGYFLLTAAGDQPFAVILDLPESELHLDIFSYDEQDYEPEMKILAIGPSRAAYQPPASLWSHSAISNFLDTNVPNRHKKTLNEEIRLSAATLDLMTEAHRVLSHETHQLGIAAADLFRRCGRLQVEFRDQIRRANELVHRIERVADEDADDYDEKDQDRPRGNAALEHRLEAVRARQEDLLNRHNKLRKKLAKRGGRALSDKEQVWVWEIQKVESSISKSSAQENKEETNGMHRGSAESWRRYEEVKELTEDLVTQAEHVADDGLSDTNGAVKVPPELRKAKVAQVMGLLERESALVDATQSRLERLSLTSFVA